MFYQADKIDSILICKICEKKMVDPRLLPCGRSVCHRCVDLLTDTDKKRIKCENCAKNHKIIKDGFPKNLALQQLLECEAKEVLRSNQLEEFKILLDILNTTKQSIESTLECGDATIRDHCDKVRNEMQLAIEQAHTKLDDIHKDFMDEIDNHEKQCQANFKSIKQNKQDIEKALNRSNELLSKSNHLLNQFKIDQTQLATLFESAQLIQTNLEAIKDGIQKNMFNESLLKFERQISFDSNVIGKVIKQNIELYFLENIENMREIDLASKLENVFFHRFLQPFKSNSFLFFYWENNILNSLCLDKDGKTLFEIKDLIKNKKIKTFYELYFYSSKNNKVIYISSGEKHLDKQEEIFFNLRSFDENFNLLAKLKLDSRPNYYGVNVKDNNLFTLTLNEGYSTISMYNQNFELVQKFGQENSLHPFFFSTDINFFLLSDKYFIITKLTGDDDTTVTIINRSNGLVEVSFKIYEYFDRIKLYLDKFLLSFNSSNCSLKCYNFKGDLLHEITLDEKFEGSTLSVFNKELCFSSFYNNEIFIF
jgi:hypothetical protein